MPEHDVDAPAADSLRVAVIGDPHFVGNDHAFAPSSHVKFDSRGDLVPKQSIQHPWASLCELVEGPDVKGADLVICVGDLSSGGDRVALETGWKHLHALGVAMGAEIMACATGNHDVFSRTGRSDVHQNVVRNLGRERGLNGNLQNLVPPYPFVDYKNVSALTGDDAHTKYFGDGALLVTTPRYRLVVLNSCSEHTTENFDFEKGSYPTHVARKLRNALDRSTETRINILVCHHPPTSHGYHGENNYDFITNGGELLTALEEHGAWLVIHGHKHHGHISYAPGGGRSPAVLAAASLGATLEQQGSGFRNQFYMLDLSLDEDDLRGRVRAWDWNYGMGFHVANRKLGGIFDGCGFGYRRSPAEVAKEIAKVTHAGLPMGWQEVREAFPNLAHVIPADYPSIEKYLKQRYSIVVEPDRNENWLTLAREAS